MQSLFKLIANLIVKTTGRGEWFFAQHAPKGSQTIVDDYAGYRFHIDTTYPIEACIWLYGKYDDMMMRFLRTFLRPEQVFVDVGANCGAFTIAAADLLEEKGHIYAFEPGPPILERLKANVALNESLHDFVTVVPLGLGKEPGTFFYQEEGHNRGNASLLNANGTPVQVVKFDDWAKENNLQKLDIIKIDVEGMELDVLLGMKESLKKWQPTVYFETLERLHQAHGSSIKSIYEFLISLGYKIVSGEDHRTSVPLDGPYPRNSIARIAK